MAAIAQAKQLAYLRYDQAPCCSVVLAAVAIMLPPRSGITGQRGKKTINHYCLAVVATAAVATAMDGGGDGTTATILTGSK